MDAPKSPPTAGYDAVAAAAVVLAALAQPGGAGLVVESLGRLPGAVATPARGGRFRSSPALVQLGQWRYEARDQGLAVAHVVGGISLAHTALPPAQAGAHVAGALGVFLHEQGVQALSDVLAVLEGLAVAAG